MRLGLFTLAGIVSALGAGPAAWAGDAVCVWQGIPEANRTAFIAAYPKEGQAALARLNAPADVLAPVMTRCGVKSRDQNRAAIGAVVAYAVQEGVAHVLHDRFGQGRAQIDAAWKALPASRREAFAKSVLAGAESGQPASSSDPALRQTAVSVVSEVAAALNITDPHAIGEIGIYLTWKVARPYYEARF